MLFGRERRERRARENSELQVDPSAWDKRRVWASHVAARKALETVVPVFEGAGIPTLAVKGVVTAYTLYDDPCERPIGDVDLRIRPEDVRRAMRVAEGAGWRIIDWKPAYTAFAIVIPGLGIAVDVESVVGAPGLCAMTIGEVISAGTEAVLLDAAPPLRPRIPQVEDHAVLLAVNVFKDKFVSAFPWAIEDARRIVETPDFDAARFADRVRAAKVAGIAWIVADWFERERGSAAWGRVKERLGGRNPPRRLYTWLFAVLTQRRTSSVAARLVARLGSDDVRAWPLSLRAALSFEWRRRSDRLYRPEPSSLSELPR